MNKEICLTISPNGADSVHPHEPIPPNHTNHSIGQLGQKSKWWEEMTTKINDIATALDKSPSNTKSNEVKISIPPKELLETKKKPYWDENLTIGPLYANLVTKSCLDDCKALCMKKFMQRHEKSDVGELIEYLIPNPLDLNNHYSNLSQDCIEAFQLLVTVDTIFIHEYLLFFSSACSKSQGPKERYYKPSFSTNKIKCNQEPVGSTDYLHNFFSNDRTYSQVWRDLFLMGNQIPMLYLTKLIEDFASQLDVKSGRLGKALFDIVMTNSPFSMDRPKKDQIAGIHLLDCQYSLFTQPKLDDTWWTNQGAGTLTSNHRDRLPTASQLSKVGIRVKACEGNVSVIKYHPTKFQLDLPRIVVHNGTEDVLRNLLAHEQTSTIRGEFTKYAVIMDSLIDTPEDVAILTKAQVIENYLGSDEKLVEMWNNMCTNIVIRSCGRWDNMKCNVMQHYHSPWRSMYVEFREKYFSRPWLTASVIAGVLLLLVTLVQIVYTILSYY